MTVSRYVAGIGVALVTGTLLGRALFPMPETVAGRLTDGGRGDPGRARLSAVPAGGGLGLAPAELFAEISEGRTSPNPGRSQFETRLKLRAMSDADALRFAERLVAGEFALTEYEAFVLTTVWGRYSKVDPAAAHRDALRLPTRSMRRAAVQIAAEAWALADPAGALAAFAGSESDNTEISSLGAVLKVLVEGDTGEAIATLDRYRGESWFSRARGSLFHSWSGVDPEAAREWFVAGMRDDPADAATMLRDLSWRDSDAALEFAFGMAPRPELQRAVGDVIAHRMMLGEGADAVAELQHVPTAWVTGALAGAVGTNGVTRLPLDQLDAVAEVFPTPELRSGFWRAALGRRASDANFDDAVAMLGRLPAGRERRDGAADLASSWARLNPAEASEWAASLPRGPGRDGAASGLASTIAPLDPASARIWAESIDDDELRAQTLDRL